MKAQNISFKGCMPMEFFAKYPKTGAYVPVVKPENVRKCQNFVVRNLNNTAGTNKCDAFVEEYTKKDRDYRELPCARSVYDKDAPMINSIHEKAPAYSYLITGNDADMVDILGKNFGQQKSDIFQRTGMTKGSEVVGAKKQYKKGIREIIERLCKRVKDENGDNLAMQVYFTPHFNKKGELIKFNYDKVSFYSQKV